MSTATEHATTLLAAIIPGRRDLLDAALRQLGPAHFADRTLANIFVMLERYAEVTGAILTREAMGDLLAHSNADAGKVALYQETYDLLAATPVDEAGFRWALQQLRELAAQRGTAAALTQGMEILTRGAAGERGTVLRGHVEARHHVLAAFADIDRALSMQDAPEGDVRAEGPDILADYAARKAARASGTTVGVDFGIPALDAVVQGLQPGELTLIVGYSSEGKTTLAAVQLPWHASVVQGRNVVVLTTESVRDQVRRKLVARHSCLEGFGIPGGICSTEIKNGTLLPDAEERLRQVVTDLTTNPGYGRCYVAQVPRAATMSYIESKLVRISRMFHIDLVVMDYLALLRADRRRQVVREELSDILKEAKQLATTFNDGAGVSFASPWQVSRSARREAESTGAYSQDALSETAEATNSPDGVISLLAPLDNDKRVVPLRMQMLKHRDGARARTLQVSVDYGTGRFFTPGDGPGTGYATGMDDLLAF